MVTLITHLGTLEDKYLETYQESLRRAVLAERDSAVRILLDHGVDPDLPDSDGKTPFHHAISLHNKAIVSLLFDQGASFASLTQLGLYPIHEACRSGRETLVKLLLDHGADPGTPDAD